MSEVLHVQQEDASSEFPEASRRSESSLDPLLEVQPPINRMLLGSRWILGFSAHPLEVVLKINLASASALAHLAATRALRALRLAPA